MSKLTDMLTSLSYKPKIESDMSTEEIKFDDDIPVMTATDMKKTILLQLGKIEENIRNKNKLIDKLKIIQEDISFVLSETNKLTSSGEPLTIEKASDLMQINALVGNIFQMMDKKTNEEIDTDIDDMMSNLRNIRTRISAINSVSDTSGTQTPKSPPKPPANPPPSGPSPPANPPSGPPTPSSYPLTPSNVEELRGKTIRAGSGGKEFQLDQKIIDFVKNYSSNYDGSGDIVDTIPADVFSKIPDNFKDGSTLSHIKMSNGIIFKYKNNPFVLNGITYHIFVNSKPPIPQFNVTNTNILVVVDDLIFRYKPNTDRSCMVSFPFDGKYVKLGIIKQLPNGEYEAKIENQIYGGKKHSKKRTKTIKRKNTKKVKFL